MAACIYILVDNSFNCSENSDKMYVPFILIIVMNCQIYNYIK